MSDKTSFDKCIDLGVRIPEVLMPAKGIELEKWAVVACDQYTSQPEYWTAVEKLVEGTPSTLDLIFPEVYLEEEGKEMRIEKINNTMRKYIDENTVVPLNRGFIYIDRKTTHAASRKGLLMLFDLEKYDYAKGSQTLIRATEGTVVDRLPPRIKIREKAALELPHIMILIDDPEKTVVEPLAEKTETFEKLYDFELMMDGGHIKGYRLQDEASAQVLEALDKLADKEFFKNRYNADSEKGVLLFAVGDGNHSLASAKGHWENVKKTLSEEEKLIHPARFALSEVVNVHDDGLQFEPIHRVVFDVEADNFFESMSGYFKNSGSGFSMKPFPTKELMEAEVKKLSADAGLHVFSYITAKGYGVISVENPKCNLEVGTLQAFLDDYSKSINNLKIDYIHGEDVVTSLGSKGGNIGFYLPTMDKHALFKTVIMDGVLPRKTFSMGEAEEKRFYLECRKIVK